jgi:hypothetical protein
MTDDARDAKLRQIAEAMQRLLELEIVTHELKIKINVAVKALKAMMLAEGFTKAELAALHAKAAVEIEAAKNAKNARNTTFQ